MKTLLSELLKLNISLECNDDNIAVYDPDNKITNEIISQIKASKSDLLILLKSVEKSEYKAIERVQIKEYYKLSSAQQRLYFIYEFDKTSVAYNMPQFATLKGEFDIEKIRSVFNKLVNRHESFRTSFEIIDDTAVQKISENESLNIEYYESTENEIPALIKKFIRPFNLNQDTLLRVGIIRISSLEHVLMIDMHHIISDGVSQGILIKEFMALYNGDELPELAICYKDFAEWQQGNEQQKKIASQKEFWIKEFTEEFNVLDLPIDYTRPLVLNHEGDSVEFEVDAEEYRRLKRIAEEAGTTSFTILLSIFNILLSKLSNQEDIILGSPSAGRQHADMEGVIGMFVNTIAIRTKLNGDFSFKEFLLHVKSKTLACFDNQDYQFGELVEELKTERDTSRNPIFDVMFEFNNLELSDLKIPGLALSTYPNEHNLSKFDIILTANEISNRYILNLQYIKALFKKETIQRYIGYFKKIISDIIINPNIKLADISLIREEDKIQLLYDFNDTNRDYNTNESIVSLFEKQVEKNQDKIAAIFTDKYITYKKLNRKANYLSLLLVENGIEKGDLIPVLIDHSIELPLALLSIMKAGAAFIPIDILWPSKRIENILKEISPKVILSTNDFLNKYIYLQQYNVIHLDINELNEDDDSPKVSISSKDMIYIIYTSGSTGNPKGVIIPNIGIMNRLYWMNEYFGSKNAQSVLQTTRYVYDSSVWQFFWPLINGGKTVILPSNTEISADVMISLISQHNVTLTDFVPSIFNIIVQQLETKKSGHLKLDELNYLIIGGEEITPRETYLFKEYFPKINLINLYGPTEASIGCVYYNIIDKKHKNIPIGKPISNTKILILDKINNIVPIAVVGEICISGDCLANGYFKDAEKTQEKFRSNPYFPGEKLYHTGDMARWLPDGNIEYLGRIDNQVKIRGFRIELGEIEACIKNFNHIKNAVVIVKEEPQNQYLCAFYVLDKRNALTQKDLEILLKEYLSSVLPYYMIPKHFVEIDEIPLTNSSKIDLNALKSIEIVIPERNEMLIPENEVEKEILTIWKSILEIDDISVDDNFFNIGGHSLKAISLLSRIEKKFFVRIAMKDFFANPSIREVSKSILKTKKTTNSTKLIPVELKEYYVASMPQKRLYFVQNLNPKDKSYNISAAFTIKGNLNNQQLENALKQLINRHKSLRTSFVTVNNEIVQKINSNVEPRLTYINEGDKDIPQIIKDFIKPFELSDKSLLRVGLVKTKKNDSVLILDMHHIISDEISNRIIFGDFVDFYNDKKLAVLKIQYVDLCVKQDIMKKQDTGNTQKLFWDNYYNGYQNDSILPYDYSKVDQLTNKGNLIAFSLEKSMIQELSNMREKYNSSIYVIILSVFNILLSKILNQNDIIVGSPITGRENPALKNIVGYLVNTLAIRNIVKGQYRFVDFLRSVNDRTLDAIDNSNYDTIEIINKINKGGRDKGKSLFDIMYTYNIVENSKMSLSNLSIEPYSIGGFSSQCDLKLRLIDNKNTLTFDFEYNENLFVEDKIHRYVKYFKKIVNDIILNPEITIDEINLTSELDEVKLLNPLLEDLE